MGAGVEIEILSGNASIVKCGVLDLIQYDRLLATGTGTQNHNWTLQTIDQYSVTETIGNDASDVAVDSGGGIHIAYGYDGPGTSDDNQLKYAHYNGYVWTTELIDSSTKQRALPGIAVGSDGTVYIAFSWEPGINERQLALATRTGTGWSIEIPMPASS